MIPLSVVRIDSEVEEAVLEVLRSGQLTQGPVVAAFERAFAELHDVPHAIAVNNGTTALVAALAVLELQPRDEVVTTPFTFQATLNAILSTGATVRFADIGDDFNLRADLVSEAVTNRTRVILPVHMFGLPVDLARFEQLATDRHLTIVEDAAHAVGATAQGRSVGAAGLGCFSLYATKNISTGEGGMVTTRDHALADRLRLLRNQGMRSRGEFEIAGFNYRLTDLAAAIGLPQLRKLADTTAKRQANAAALRAGLDGIGGLVPPPMVPDDRTHVYHQFTVRITEDARLDRDSFVAALSERGVSCGVYYRKLVHDHDCYRDDPRIHAGPLPNASLFARQVASLPVHPHLSEADLDQIVAAVRTVLA